MRGHRNLNRISGKDLFRLPLDSVFMAAHSHTRSFKNFIDESRGSYYGIWFGVVGYKAGRS